MLVNSLRNKAQRFLDASQDLPLDKYEEGVNDISSRSVEFITIFLEVIGMMYGEVQTFDYSTLYQLETRGMLGPRDKCFVEAAVLKVLANVKLLIGLWESKIDSTNDVLIKTVEAPVRATALVIRAAKNELFLF